MSAADAPMADAPPPAAEPAAPAAPAAPPTSVCGANMGVTPGARLMIREMVLDNFKSYAGEQRVGPFHKCFSSVVGPNGSGKSNVIDAMLFVFGRRAKQLRFNKVSELIHNSASHRALERACVTVHFQEIFDTADDGAAGDGENAAPGGAAAGSGDGDTYTVVEGSGFTVARTATRSNSSDYYVNGRKCGVKEVAALLKSKGIDLDNNRFLILQGEVEQISLMKPRGEAPGDTGLLEYLEDIIGTDGLVPQIEEHGKRLDELNERRQSMIAKLKAVERDRSALEGRKLEAEAYLSKQAERLRLRLAGNLAHGRRHEVGLAEAAAKASEFQARLEHERAKFKAFDGELKAANDAATAADDARGAATGALEKAQADFKKFELKDTKLRMDLAHARTKLKKAQAKAKADAEAVAALEADVARLEGTEIPAAEALVEALQRDLAAAEATVERLQASVKGEVEALRAQLGAVRAELAPWEQQMREVQARVDVATSERDLVLREQAEAAGRLEQAREGLAAAAAEADAKEREIAAMRAELESARSDEAFAREAAEAATRAEAELEEALRALRARAGALRQESSSASTANAALAALLDAKRTKAIPGLHGRLGDLGAIDPALDAAISTSCPQLDHIVVDTMVDAQKGVELLRKGQLGVRSFLILERQRHLAPRLAAGAPAPLPEGCVRLYDAVKPASEAARLAFYSVLRDSVVTETTDQARELVFARGSPFRRAVTRSGAVVEAGGTLTGGGQPRRGRMRVGDKAPAASAGAADAKAAAAELAQAEKELAAGDERLRQARDEKEAGLKAAAACAKRAAQLEVALPKAAAVVDAKREAARDLEGRLGELEAAAVARPEDEKRARELARQLSDEAIALAKLRASSGGLSKRAAELQSKIELAGGEPLRKARAQAATLAKKIADAEGDGAAKTAQARHAAKQLARLRKEGGGGGKGGAADAEKQLEAEVAAALEALKAIEADALAVMARVETLQVEAAAAREAADAARQARDAKSAEVGVIRSVEAEVEAALAKLAAAQRDHAAEAKRLAREVEADAAALEGYLPRLAAVERAAEAAEDGEGGEGERDDGGAEAQEAGEEEEEEEEGMDVDGEARPPASAKGGKGAASASASAPPSSSSTGGLPAGTTFDARGVPVLSEAQLDALSTDDLFYRVAVLDEQLRAMSPDLDAIDAYADKARDFAEKAGELAAATAERDAARRAHDALRKARLDGFMEGFNAISLKLKEMYQMITLGGDAELELVDTLDPFSEGIVFSVRPPKKSWKHIANLSGGEKTLSSLSLVFALHHYRPTPLYVMDEIDAALDFKNVSIVGHYIKERTKNAQFVIISLRNNMFELADRLVGIYKTDNATKTVAINPGQFCVGAGGKKKEGKKADDEAEAGENRRPGRRALAAA